MHWCFNVCMIFKQLPHILAEQKVVFALHDVAVVPNALSHDI